MNTKKAVLVIRFCGSMDDAAIEAGRQRIREERTRLDQTDKQLLLELQALPLTTRECEEKEIKDMLAGRNEKLAINVGAVSAIAFLLGIVLWLLNSYDVICIGPILYALLLFFGIIGVVLAFFMWMAATGNPGF